MLRRTVKDNRENIYYYTAIIVKMKRGMENEKNKPVKMETAFSI